MTNITGADIVGVPPCVAQPSFQHRVLHQTRSPVTITTVKKIPGATLWLDVCVLNPAERTLTSGGASNVRGPTKILKLAKSQNGRGNARPACTLLSLRSKKEPRLFLDCCVTVTVVGPCLGHGRTSTEASSSSSISSLSSCSSHLSSVSSFGFMSYCTTPYSWLSVAVCVAWCGVFLFRVLRIFCLRLHILVCFSFPATIHSLWNKKRKRN